MLGTIPGSLAVWPCLSFFPFSDSNQLCRKRYVNVYSSFCSFLFFNFKMMGCILWWLVPREKAMPISVILSSTPGCSPFSCIATPTPGPGRGTPSPQEWRFGSYMKWVGIADLHAVTSWDGTSTVGFNRMFFFVKVYICGSYSIVFTKSHWPAQDKAMPCSICHVVVLPKSVCCANLRIQSNSILTASGI